MIFGNWLVLLSLVPSSLLDEIAIDWHMRWLIRIFTIHPSKLGFNNFWITLVIWIPSSFEDFSFGVLLFLFLTFCSCNDTFLLLMKLRLTFFFFFFGFSQNFIFFNEVRFLYQNNNN